MDLMVILRQIWNQRRSYGWILAELIVVSFFLWLMIEPVYVLMANKALPNHYDMNDTYLLQVGEYPENHGKYDPAATSDSVKRADFMRIVDKLRRYPGVTCLTVTNWNSFPQSGSYNGGQMGRDTTFVQTQYMSFLSGTDYFGVFRIHQPKDGQIPAVLSKGETGVYITSGLADKLFLGEVADNKEVCLGDTARKSRVLGVIDPVRIRSNEQPHSLAYQVDNELILRFPWGSQICFRVRDGLSSAAFTETMKRELRSQLQSGNLYMLSLSDFNSVSRNYEYGMGVTNKLRLLTILASFFILCTFLGMGGTFWVQCNARRAEIGLYRAMGCTRRRLITRFLVESWWLVTIASLIGALLQLQMVYFTGFAFTPKNGNPDYLQNQPVAHFLIVSAITYVLILVTSLLATYIPVAKASKMKPTEALRDE